MGHTVTSLREAWFLSFFLKITNCDRWILGFISHTTHNLSICQITEFCMVIGQVLNFIAAGAQPGHRFYNCSTCPIWPHRATVTDTNYVSAKLLKYTLT